jgi:hypothetical protein
MIESWVWKEIAGGISHRLKQSVPNPTATWKGASLMVLRGVPLTPRRLLRIGDCSWQEIKYAHTMGAPGYPRYIGERLLGRGIAMQFENHFALDYPSFDLRRLDDIVAPPDVVLLHLGASYGIREILPMERAGLEWVSLWANYRLGRCGAATHRSIVAPVSKRFGRVPRRPRLESISTDMRMLLAGLRGRFGDVPVAVLLPHTPIRDGWACPAAIEEAAERQRAAATDLDLQVIDYREALNEASESANRLYGANGFDLCRPGHEVIAAMVFNECLAPLWMDSDPMGAADAEHRRSQILSSGQLDSAAD